MSFTPYRAFLNNRWYLGTANSERGEWRQSINLMDLYYKPKDVQKITDCSMCPQTIYRNFMKCTYPSCENFNDYLTNWKMHPLWEERECCQQKKD